ncbi:hypothetical protein HOD29_03550 [archaeon]|jgi:hypothetical protein|nr:hypothetical protein [archaeon]
MKKLILLFILLLPIISAIQITEVESNPLGQDSGNEWIEFYSEEEINLSGFKIINNDAGEIKLNQTFTGYFIYKFQNQWLDNVDEKIYLYNQTNLIQSTSVIEDSSNNEQTFQLCGEDWSFKESTKSKENNCPKEEIIQEITGEIQEQILEEILVESESNTPTRNKSLNSMQKEESPPETIELNPKTIKTTDNSSDLENKGYGKYFLGGFCLILLLLFALKKTKRKNEFN